MVEKISLRFLDSSFDKRPRRRKWVGLVTLVIAFGVFSEVSAQPTKIPRIGRLSITSPPAESARMEALILIRFQDETKYGRVGAWEDHGGLTGEQ